MIDVGEVVLERRLAVTVAGRDAQVEREPRQLTRLLQLAGVAPHEGEVVQRRGLRRVVAELTREHEAVLQMRRGAAEVCATPRQDAEQVVRLRLTPRVGGRERERERLAGERTCSLAVAGLVQGGREIDLDVDIPQPPPRGPRAAARVSWRSEAVQPGHRLRRLAVDAARAGTATIVSPVRLTQDEVGALVQAARPGTPGASLQRRVYLESEGLPLFVAQYLAAQAGGGTPAHDGLPAANLERLAGVVDRWRATNPDGSQLRAGNLRAGGALALRTPHCLVDLLSEQLLPAPFGDVLARADRKRIDGVEVPICSLADLVAMKRSSGPGSDELDLERLREAHGELPGDV